VRSALAYNPGVDGYIGLGSNLGDPVAELRGAVSELESRGVEVQRRSSLYQTEPVDAPNQAWFVNAVAAIRFGGQPHELLQICLSVEASRGRERTVKNVPRILDLDVLLLGEQILSTEALTVPHPRLHERRFVLEPMVEIAPEAVHPGLRKTMEELLRECPDASRVVRLEDAFAQ
jgi:2-amino-4-hydroxy-6-hydroxymethyldihydropteridine diphosphokinase